jgi:hypothetical protein
MRDAKTIEVADAVVERIVSRLDDPGSATVEREYVVDEKIDLPAGSGRKVYVLPFGLENQGPASRAADVKDVRIGVLVAERYSGQGKAPAEWCDVRTRWVESQIWDRMQDPRQRLLLGRFWPQLSNWLVFEPNKLRDQKVFWSEIEVTFREDD